MEALRTDNADEAQYKDIRRGWRFGGKEFVARLLDIAEGKLGESHTHREREETMEARARRIIAEGLREAGWNAAQLSRECKGHLAKAAMARRLRGETTMSLKWIAQALSMGTWTNVANHLRPRKKPEK